MIPKIIHYCWLSRDPLPTEARECIKSWRKYMPDWEIKLWNTDNFDVSSVPFVAEAVAARKWAFAADYIRCYAVYTEGGIYLDSDVLVRKPMDFILDHRAFSAIEYIPDSIDAKAEVIARLKALSGQEDLLPGVQIQAAIIGAEKGHPFFKDCLDYYRSIHFSSETQISPIVFAEQAFKYGFELQNKEQMLAEGFKLYDSALFCSQPYLMKPEAVAVHCCNASWRTNDSKIQNMVNNVKIRIKALLIKLGLRTERNIEKIR